MSADRDERTATVHMATVAATVQAMADAMADVAHEECRRAELARVRADLAVAAVKLRTWAMADRARGMNR